MMSKQQNQPIALNLQSSFFHATPLDQILAPYLSNYEYLYSNNTQFGLGYIHNGYIKDTACNLRVF